MENDMTALVVLIPFFVYIIGNGIYQYIKEVRR